MPCGWVAPPTGSKAGEGGPTRGLGAVTILVGEEALTWLEMDKVSFQVAS